MKTSQGHSKWGHGNGTGNSEALNKHLSGASKKMGEKPSLSHSKGQKVNNK